MIREIELKYRFQNRQDFLNILNSFSQKPLIEQQTNYFFDTPDLRLKSQHVFLRLRRSNDAYKFTCKGKPENMDKPDGNLSIHDEWEQYVETKDAESLLAGAISPLKLLERSWPIESSDAQQTRLSLLKRINVLLSDSPIGFVGSFRNTRTHVPYLLSGQELDLEFDETDFGNGVVNYELEVELSSTEVAEVSEKKLSELFRQLGIQTSASTGKAERFFKQARPN